MRSCGPKPGSALAEPFERLKSAVRFRLRLTPKGGRDALEGWAADATGKMHLKARVSAPSEDGKANKALVELLAKKFNCAKSAIRIVSGETSRLKRIEIAGNTEALAQKLQEFGNRT